MSVLPPVAARKPHTVLFGKVEGEDRGPNPMNPPRSHIDDLFWIRDDERKDPAVLDLLQKEKAYYEHQTQDIQGLISDIYDEHISHICEDDISAPSKDGPFYYYAREVKGKSYKIHCRISADQVAASGGIAAATRNIAHVEGEEIIMDINQVADGKAFCDVSEIEVAPDHCLVAFSVDYSGNEVYTIEFKSMNEELTPAPLDKIENTNGEIIWGKNASYLFYVTKDAALRDDKIWIHTLGTPQSSDICLYEESDALYSAFMYKSADQNTLLIGSSSSETTEISLLDLRDKNAFTKEDLEMVRPREKGVRYMVSMHGADDLIILTNKDGAVNQKLLSASRVSPGEWSAKAIVDASADIFMEGVTVRKSFLVINGSRGGNTRLWTLSVDSSHKFSFQSVLKEVAFPDPVYTVDIAPSQMPEYETLTFRAVYSSLSTPSTWLDIAPETEHAREIVKVREVGGGFNSDDYVVERLFATSADKTQIPISIVRRKDLDLSKPQPCMLYGYGSYGLNVDPAFSIRYLPFCDRGMIYAIAHIRGGAEMGRAWYEVGAKYLTKRNTFMDFISAAEHLIEEGLTAPEMLSCEGRSAGGLLVGAVLNMRPDLFKAAIAGVPFVDVMTTMCDASIPLTTGEWEEWGNPNEYKYYHYMLSYSPLDNIRRQEYPNIMVQAGLHDPRVAYWEPAKWVQRLRELKTDSNEILLNMDLESGHFSAKDRYKYWKESAIQQAFICKHLKSVARLLIK